MTVTRKARAMLLIPLMTGLAIACSDQPLESPVVESETLAPSIDVVAGDAQMGTVGQQLPDPLVVRLTDPLGRPLDEQPVTFHVTSGEGSVFAGSVLTDEEGRAQEWWTLGSSEGENTLEARAVDPESGKSVVQARFSAKGVAVAAEEESADEARGGVTSRPSQASDPAWNRGVWNISGGGVSAVLDLDRETITIPRYGTFDIKVQTTGNRLIVTIEAGAYGSGTMSLTHANGELRGTATGEGRNESVVGHRSSTPAPSPAPDAPNNPRPSEPKPSQPPPAAGPGTGGDGSGSAVLFEDDFENYAVGSMIHGNGSNGFSWTRGNGDGVYVADDRSRSGSRALRFRFDSTPQNSHIWAEQRFRHPELQEYWVEYYVYVADNYYHQPANTSANNNKFYAFWGANGYSAPGAGSFQLWTPKSGSMRGGSTINVGRYGPNDRHLTYPRESGRNGGPILSTSDAGSWIRIRIHLKLADPGQANGVQRLWKNDQLIVDVRGDRNDAGSRNSNYYSLGYLFGYDNSRYPERTDFYIDDFRMYSSNPGW